MRAWMFVALAACACKASGNDGPDSGTDAASGPMGHLTYESQYCSGSLSEMPLYTCSPDFPLVCISTYQQTVTPDGGGGAMMRPVFVCRLSCTPDTGCTGGDVCCAGTGMNGQTVHGCVPANACLPAP